MPASSSGPTDAVPCCIRTSVGSLARVGADWAPATPSALRDNTINVNHVSFAGLRMQSTSL